MEIRPVVDGSWKPTGWVPSNMKSLPPLPLSSLDARGRSSVLWRLTPPIGCPNKTPETRTFGPAFLPSVATNNSPVGTLGAAYCYVGVSERKQKSVDQPVGKSPDW